MTCWAAADPLFATDERTASAGAGGATVRRAMKIRIPPARRASGTERRRQGVIPAAVSSVLPARYSASCVRLQSSRSGEGRRASKLHDGHGPAVSAQVPPPSHVRDVHARGDEDRPPIAVHQVAVDRHDGSGIAHPPHAAVPRGPGRAAADAEGLRPLHPTQLLTTCSCRAGDARSGTRKNGTTAAKATFSSNRGNGFRICRRALLDTPRRPKVASQRPCSMARWATRSTTPGATSLIDAPTLPRRVMMSSRRRVTSPGRSAARTPPASSPRSRGQGWSQQTSAHPDRRRAGGCPWRRSRDIPWSPCTPSSANSMRRESKKPAMACLVAA